MTKLDVLLKEDAAHTGSHTRIGDTLHEHDGRLKKLEGATLSPGRPGAKV
jgi:hypothetical protein